MQNKDHKLAAIIFTDIVGYTRQMEEDEQRTMELLQHQREIIFPLVKDYHGEVIKEIGDGLLIMFNSAVDAVRFAIKAQQKLKDEELTIRAGIHMGDVIFKDGDVFGSAVNTAARIEPLAEPNGICISESVKNQLGNKNIRMISCGKKELKGVNQPIEIFEVYIEGVSQEKKVTVSSFFNDLWKRNVLQIAAIYFIAAWIIKLAVSSIVARNLLSPHLVELIWIILLSLIPTVLIVSYFHGKGKANKWHKAELIGLPTNLLLTALLIVFMFNGKDLGAATQSVTIKNEDGISIEHQIVKSEFRKKICLYNLKNISNDTSLNWMQYLIPAMLEYDLYQDVYIRPLASIKFYQKLETAGYKEGIDLPISLMKKFASYYHLQYFSTGTYDFKNGQYTITTKLYETKNGKLIKERVYTDADFFKISDAITVHLKEDMGLPKAHIDQVIDLPVSDLFTHSLLALKYYAIANKELVLGHWQPAINYFDLAIAEDPDFTVCYMTMVGACFNTNQIEKSKKALDETMAQIDKIPERIQFTVKFAYYLINQEPEKSMSVLKMWADLYPDDIEPHSMLASRYLMANNTKKAIEECKIVLKLDPEQYDYLSEIGKLYDKIGESDSALAYFHLYAEKFPKDYKSYVNIGDYYEKLADFSNAKKYYEKASLLEPLEVSVNIKLAHIDFDFGHFNKAHDTYKKALKASKNAKDSTLALRALSGYYRSKGEISKSLNYFENSLEIRKKYTPPMQVTIQKCISAPHYIDGGKEKEIFAYLNKAKAELNPPMDKVTAFGFMFFYIELGDADNAEKQIADAEELAKGFGEEKLIDNIKYGRGKIHEIRGEYEEAINSFNDFFVNQVSNYGLRRDFCRIYRKMGKYSKAEENILLNLKHAPYSGKGNYEAALLYFEMGDMDKGIQHLKTASMIIENGDPEYQFFKDVQAKLVEMELVN